jgi:glycerophosphoryl diester phosphodiesterase
MKVTQVMQTALCRAWASFPPLSVTMLTLLVLSGCASRFDIQAHRGGRGLSPENTLPAFARAQALGVTTLELDVGVSADDVLVIAHDPKLNPNLTRSPNGEYLDTPGPALRSLSYAQIKQYDVGRIKADSAYAKLYPEQVAIDGISMPRLVDLFEQLRASGDHRTRLNIETKIRPDQPAETADPETFVRLLLTAIRDFGFEKRTSIQSFDWRTLQLVQQLAPGIATVYLTIQASGFNNIEPAQGPSWTAGLTSAAKDSLAGRSIPALVKQAGGTVWSPYYRDLKAEQVKAAKALGIKVVVWTVNEVQDMKTYIDMGVDGIITDRPDLLLGLRP